MATLPARTRAPAPTGAGAFLWLAAALAALASPPARADEPTISVEVGPTVVHFDYAEYYRTGATIDRERGWVPGVALRAELASGRLFAIAAGSLASGSVTYDGRTQSSNPANDELPVETRTATGFASAEARAGGWLDERHRVALYGGGASRYWERDIHGTTVTSRSGATIPVSGLYEEYSWWELQAGVRWAFLEAPGIHLELDARVFHALRPRLAVDWNGERVELSLGARPGLRLALASRIDLGGRWFLAVEADAARFELGESAVDPASMIMEPRSRTTNARVEARLGARF